MLILRGCPVALVRCLVMLKGSTGLVSYFIGILAKYKFASWTTDFLMVRNKN